MDPSQVGIYKDCYIEVSTTEITLSEVSISEVSIVKLSVAKVSLCEVGFSEIGFSEVTPSVKVVPVLASRTIFESFNHAISSTEIGLTEISRHQVGIVEINVSKVGSMKVSIGEIDPTEVNPAEIRTYFRMLLSPSVPLLYAAFESLKLFLIYHSIMLPIIGYS